MLTLNVLPLLLAVADDVPEEEDVTAGWLAFGIFIVLILAVAFLGWSLTKQLRKAQAAEDAGLYGHDVAPGDAAGTVDGDRAGNGSDGAGDRD